MSEKTTRQNDWYHAMPGLMLVKAEKNRLNRWLSKYRVRTVLQIGHANFDWIKDQRIKQICVMSSTATHQCRGKVVVADYSSLPIESESVDAVLMPHVLSNQENIFPILQEACRVLKPNGQLIILDLNKNGIWRFCRALGVQKEFFRSKNFLSSISLKTELQRLGLIVAHFQSVCFAPPFAKERSPSFLRFLEAIGQLFFSKRGAGFMLVAIKKVPGATVIPARNHLKNANWRSVAVQQTTRSCHE